MALGKPLSNLTVSNLLPFICTCLTLYLLAQVGFHLNLVHHSSFRLFGSGGVGLCHHPTNFNIATANPTGPRHLARGGPLH